MTTRAAIVMAYPRAAPVVGGLLLLAQQLGVDPAWLANLIQFESRWSPQARNTKSGATGLIQFMPKTAASLGTSTTQLYGMTAAQQWPYVVAYLSRFRGRIRSQRDLFMAVFYPVAMGKGDGWTFPAKVRRVNGGIRNPADYEARAMRVARLPSTSTLAAPRSSLPSGKPSSVHSWTRGTVGQRGRFSFGARTVAGVSALSLAVMAIWALAVRRRHK